MSKTKLWRLICNYVREDGSFVGPTEMFNAPGRTAKEAFVYMNVLRHFENGELRLTRVSDWDWTRVKQDEQ